MMKWKTTRIAYFVTALVVVGWRMESGGMMMMADATLQPDGSCPVISMFPFSIRHGRWKAQANQEFAFSFLAAAQLAMDHFNARDASVVPQVASLLPNNAAESCPVRFAPQQVVLDTQSVGVDAVHALWKATQQQQQLSSQLSSNHTSGGTSSSGSSSSSSSSAQQQQQPSSSQSQVLPACAVLGPMDSRAAEEVAPVTAALQLPQLFYHTELNRFHVRGYDNTVATVLSPAARAQAMLEYLAPLDPAAASQRRRPFLAVAHYGKDGSSDLPDALKDLGPAAPYHMIAVETFQRPLGKNSAQHVVERLHQTGITTLLLNFDNPRSIVSMAAALDDYDMLTSNYLYILSPDAVPTDRVDQIYGSGAEVGTALDKLLSGALIFDAVDPFRLPPRGGVNNNNDNDDNIAMDPFLNAWKQLDEKFVHRINALHPLDPSHAAYYQAPANFFQTRPPSNNLPANFCSFVYDAVMTLGLGACQAWRSDNLNNNKQVEEEDNDNDDDGDSDTTASLLSQEQMVEGMKQTVFDGASGRVRFPDGESYRNPADITVGLYYIRPITTTVDNDKNGTITTIQKRSYQAILSAVRSPQTTSNNDNGDDSGAGRWKTVQDIIYKDGTTNPPPTLRHVENNYLSRRIRIIGLTIFALTWVLAIAAIVLVTKVLRHDEIIQRAQPFFLILQCVGSLITSIAILTLSWDEGAGATKRQLDVACMSTQWFFFLGHITTFMALFAKLWRVDRVLQFRRTAVPVRKVLGPLLALIAMAVVLLILWTALDPWTWQREWIRYVPAETYGQCTSDHFWAFFGPLMTLLVAAEVVVAIFAWKTADIPTEFGDSRPAVYAICAHLQAWAIGLPVLAVLGDDSADATYFGRVFLIWIFSITSIVVVVGPKIYRAVQLRIRPNDESHHRGRRRGSVHVSGVFPAPVSRVFSSPMSLTAGGGTGASNKTPSDKSDSGGDSTALSEKPNSKASLVSSELFTPKEGAPHRQQPNHSGTASQDVSV